MLEIQYPQQEEIMLTLTPMTRRVIIHALLSEDVQRAIHSGEGWKLVINGKGSSIQAVLEKRWAL